MKKRRTTPKAAARRRKQKDGMLPEYDFDYSKAKPNRFAALLAGQKPKVTKR